jgi:hypothetical protein
MQTNTATVPATPLSGRQPLTRWMAFTIHFGISLVIFLVLLALMIGVWYPDFFFTTDGGWEGLQILIGVDLVLGPALTAIVYRPYKRGLLLDLTLIGLAQLICLLIGTYIIYTQRPLAVVYVDDHFISVSQGSFDFAGTDSASLKTLPGKYPKQIYINLPKDKTERKALRKAQTHQGPLHARPTLFFPYAEHGQEAVSEGGINIDIYRKGIPEKAADFDAWLQQKNYQDDQIVLAPYTARYQDSYLVLDRQSGKILGLLPRNLTF